MSAPAAVISPGGFGSHWLVVADSHVGYSVFGERVRRAADLARAAAAAEGGSITATLHVGDGNESPASSFLEWWDGPEPVIMAPGNWDAETLPGEIAAPDPYATFRSRFPWFGNREWARVSIGPVSVYILSNCDDVLTPSGLSAYGNCNPPGDPHSLNPSWSGILDPGSEQRLWLAAELAADTHPHKIVIAHRPGFAPFSGVSRPVFNAFGELLAGLPFGWAFGGDIHIGSVVGPLGTGGTIFATFAGAYTVRQVDLEAYPGLPVLWSSGSASGSSGLAHVGLLSFGDASRLRVYQSSNAFPDGGLAFEYTRPQG